MTNTPQESVAAPTPTLGPRAITRIAARSRDASYKSLLPAADTATAPAATASSSKWSVLRSIGTTGHESNSTALVAAARGLTDFEAKQGAVASGAAYLTHVPSESYAGLWQQGDARHYEEHALEQRYALRHHLAVIVALSDWWGLVQVIDGDEGVSSSEYTFVMRKVYRALVAADDFDEAEARATVAEDWKRDSAGTAVMSRDTFFDALFELADLWTDSTAAADYVHFLGHLLDAITRGDGIERTFLDDADIALGSAQPEIAIDDASDDESVPSEPDDEVEEEAREPPMLTREPPRKPPRELPRAPLRGPSPPAALLLPPSPSLSPSPAPRLVARPPPEAVPKGRSHSPTIPIEPKARAPTQATPAAVEFVELQSKATTVSRAPKLSKGGGVRLKDIRGESPPPQPAPEPRPTAAAPVEARKLTKPRAPNLSSSTRKRRGGATAGATDARGHRWTAAAGAVKLLRPGAHSGALRPTVLRTEARWHRALARVTEDERRRREGLRAQWEELNARIQRIAKEIARSDAKTEMQRKALVHAHSLKSLKRGAAAEEMVEHLCSSLHAEVEELDARLRALREQHWWAVRMRNATQYEETAASDSKKPAAGAPAKEISPHLRPMRRPPPPLLALGPRERPRIHAGPEAHMGCSSSCVRLINEGATPSLGASRRRMVCSPSLPAILPSSVSAASEASSAAAPLFDARRWARAAAEEEARKQREAALRESPPRSTRATTLESVWSHSQRGASCSEAGCDTARPSEALGVASSSHPGRLFAGGVAERLRSSSAACLTW